MGHVSYLSSINHSRTGSWFDWTKPCFSPYSVPPLPEHLGLASNLGAHINLGFVDKGEAYTHSAGVVLGLPTASDDFRAIQVLEFQMQNLPCPILRSFDIFGFALEAGLLPIGDCEKVRSCLLREGRWIPAALKNSSFANGITNFSLRLRDSSKAPSSAAQAPTRYSDPLYVTRI